MKNLLKKLGRHVWRSSTPVRRPLAARFDRHMVNLLHQIPQPPAPPADLDLVLESVVRDLARLQVQVERLRQEIEEMPKTEGEARPEGRPSVVAGTG